MPRPARHITRPKGFHAAGIACGIKTSGKNDLAIVAAETDVPTAIVTTRNQVLGAPVLWCRRVLPRGYGKMRGIVINAGCANTCTGPAGLKDAAAMAGETAKHLGAETEKVLVASTGVIGHPLPMDKIRRGIAKAAGALGTSGDSAALRAIMTTDTREKAGVVTARIGGQKITLAGMVKGSGMISPSMATMIAVITTDAAITPRSLHKALTQAVEKTFNAITVDSDTSTSDTVAAFASGLAGNQTITPGAHPYSVFAKAMLELCDKLARAVVADGEGATRVFEVLVRGARSEADARTAAKAVADSPLVKCAVHGADPNWGRIAVALGKSAAKIVPEKLRIRIGGLLVFSGGTGREFDLRRVRSHLRGKHIRIECDLGLGRGAYTALGCDLSRRYVTINADYHT